MELPATFSGPNHGEDQRVVPMNSHTFWKAVEVALLGMVALVVPVTLFVQRRNALREAQAKEMFRVNTIKD